MSEPDWAALKKVGVEVETLVRAEKFTRADFLRLFPIAREAARGEDDLLEFLYNEAEPEWLDDVPAA